MYVLLGLEDNSTLGQILNVIYLWLPIDRLQRQTPDSPPRLQSNPAPDPQTTNRSDDSSSDEEESPPPATDAVVATTTAEIVSDIRNGVGRRGSNIARTIATTAQRRRPGRLGFSTMSNGCSKKVILTTTTMIFACTSFACLCIAISTDHWLYAIERQGDGQTVNLTFMHTSTGLWRKCVHFGKQFQQFRADDDV